MASIYHDCESCGNEWTHTGCSLRAKDDGLHICPKGGGQGPTNWSYVEDDFTLYVKTCRKTPEKALNEILD